MTLSREELEAHWMPFTGNRQFKDNPRLLERADGVYYYDTTGRQIFDGLSGLWTCGAGHNRPEIVEAVSRQVSRLAVRTTQRPLLQQHLDQSPAEKSAGPGYHYIHRHAPVSLSASATAPAIASGDTVPLPRGPPAPPHA